MKRMYEIPKTEDVRLFGKDVMQADHLDGGPTNGEDPGKALVSHKVDGATVGGK